jgi:hypothetical protein
MNEEEVPAKGFHELPLVPIVFILVVDLKGL